MGVRGDDPKPHILKPLIARDARVRGRGGRRDSLSKPHHALAMIGANRGKLGLRHRRSHRERTFSGRILVVLRPHH